MGLIHVNRGGKSLGQLTEQELSNGVASGEILPTDLAWREGMETWQQVSTFESLPAPTQAPAETGVPARLTNSDPNRLQPGNIDYGDCLRKGWDAFGKNWGVCIVAVIVFFAISIVTQIPMQLAQVVMGKFAPAKGADPATLAAVSDPAMFAASGAVFLFFWVLASAISMLLTAGALFFFITTLRTKANLDLLFAGFRRECWLQVLLASIAWIVLFFVPAIVFVIPGVVLSAIMKSAVPALVGGVLFIVPIIYMSVGIGFAFPLIIDRGIGFWEAIVTAFRTVHRQWFSVLGLLILVGLITISGVLLFIVGLLATVPLGYLIWSQGYRQIFGDPDSARVD
jgi:hypothetical protein